MAHPSSPVKRIVITGAESTGKSTLARALSAHYGEPVTKEFVRSYVDRIGRALAHTDLEPIARGQIAAEDADLESAQRLILHDTNLLSSILYADYYFNTTIDWVDRIFLEREYTLYLLCLPDIPWVPEPGQRDSTDARDRLHQRFQAKLDTLNLPYARVGGSHAARLETALQAIDSVL